MSGYYTEYTWVFALAVIFSFIGAFGIGANDVANAFATSVGAKSITLKQAVIIATIFEFSGAFFMGSHVAKTIRKGITDLELFQDSEDDTKLLMFGMMVVTFSVAAWLLIATYWSLPVSTTHTCVGSIAGFAIAAKGWDAVNWDVMIKIVFSWFFSPILSGLVAILLYTMIKSAILKSDNPPSRTLLFYPILVSFCVIIVVFYTIYKGTPQLGLKDTEFWVACVIAFATGVFAYIVTYFIGTPLLVALMETNKIFDFGADEQQEDHIEMVSDTTTKPEACTEKTSQLDLKKQNTIDRFIPDVEKRFQDNASPQVLEMLSKAEQHDVKAELAFSYLQVFSACFDAFAHGANDVANSVGPLAAVYGIWDTGVVEKNVDMPLWILGLGGVGIVAGLMLYGYNIMQAIGFELTKLSPSRGFSIELGAALVVLTGSRLEIPLSTTHCQVGATVGVGLTEGCGNVNWWLFANVVAGWFFTIVISSVFTGLFIWVYIIIKRTY